MTKWVVSLYYQTRSTGQPSLVHIHVGEYPSLASNYRQQLANTPYTMMVHGFICHRCVRSIPRGGANAEDVAITALAFHGVTCGALPLPAQLAPSTVPAQASPSSECWKLRFLAPSPVESASPLVDHPRQTFSQLLRLRCSQQVAAELQSVHDSENASADSLQGRGLQQLDSLG